MHRTVQSLVAILTLLAFQVKAEASTLQQCVTKYGTKSVNNIPSNTFTLSLPVTVTSKITSTPVKTITPSPTTTTQTVTTFQTSTTTAPTTTETVTLTNTATATESPTVTAPASTFVTTTTVTSTSTSTVPTVAGFTPISQENGYRPKIKGRNIDGLAARANQIVIAKINKGAKAPVFSPQVYPTAVVCAKIVKAVTTKTVTVTATTTQTTTLSPVTSTVSATTTSTVTTTSIPPAVTSTATTSTTVTTTSTTTVTPTTTTTATATATVAGPVIYAACDSNNIVNRANGGQAINNLGYKDSGSFSISSASSAYDCCVLCQQSDCQGFGLAYGNCYLVSKPTCAAGGFNGAFYLADSNESGDILTVGNGPCGALANGY